MQETDESIIHNYEPSFDGFCLLYDALFTVYYQPTSTCFFINNIQHVSLKFLLSSNKMKRPNAQVMNVGTFFY
jgi:hypothetical protein